MKIKFRQKIYLWVLFVFLLFFNTVIFTLRAVQNSKNLARQKESLLAQQEYIIQQVVDDMSAVYQSRPLGIPYIIQPVRKPPCRKGNTYVGCKWGQCGLFLCGKPGR